MEDIFASNSKSKQFDDPNIEKHESDESITHEYRETFVQFSEVNEMTQGTEHIQQDFEFYSKETSFQVNNKEEEIHLTDENEYSSMNWHEKENGLQSLIDKAVDMFRSSKKIVFFTGAGISVESGIPDFRSSCGLWERFDPDIYANFEIFLKEPEKFWEMTKEMARMMQGIRPNSAHEAISAFEHQFGKEVVVITQNIDNLHQEAGSSQVLEVHGNIRTASCISCKSAVHYQEIYSHLGKEMIPKCKKCQSLVKTDVILFGESLPSHILEEAFEAAQTCDLLVMVGSSLQVAPANLIPSMAKMSGAKLLFINKSVTTFDTSAHLVLYGSASKILSRIVETYQSSLPTIEYHEDEH